MQYAADIDRGGCAVRDVLAVLAGDVEGEEVRIGLWRRPHDPALPALATVADPAAIVGLATGP